MTWTYNAPHLEANISLWKDWLATMTDSLKNGTGLPYFHQAIKEAQEHIDWVEARLNSGKSWGENKAAKKAA